MALGSYFRLLHAGFVLAREGALSLADAQLPPGGLKLAVGAGRLFERRSVRRVGGAERLTRALNRLGPTYVKFGQTLATRPDIVGPQIAADLAQLQDAMEPFDAALVPGILVEALGEKAAALRELSPPLAAASIAQVHQAILEKQGEMPRKVAVKVLRPGVARRFHADLDSYRAAARLAERVAPSLRRLRPTDIVDTLDRSARIELDLRLEAAAISEFSENIRNDEGFIVPAVHWDQTAENVLTTTWVEGIPIRDLAALEAEGLDRKVLARNLLQSFLRHAIRDGFFHADMHPGNLFAQRGTGNIIAVDFGIMGRITRRERRFLAEILYGFITRNYRMIAERHFEIGYVPRTQSVDEFTLALRSIGEPLFGRTAADISMAKVLGQLFAVTDMFDMQTRPELLLLQKNMVLVEGVARSLDPDLDMWSISEPVVGDFVRREAGPLGRLEDLRDGLAEMGDIARRLAPIIKDAEVVLALHRRDREAGVRPRLSLHPLIVLVLLALLAVLVALLWRIVF